MKTCVDGLAWPPLPPDALLLNACPYLCGNDSFSLLLGLLCFSAVYALCPCSMFQTSPSLCLPSADIARVRARPSGGVARPVTPSQPLPQTDFFLLLLSLPPAPAGPTTFIVASGRQPVCRSCISPRILRSGQWPKAHLQTSQPHI